MAETIYETIKDSDGVECFIKRGNLVRCKDCKHGRIYEHNLVDCDLQELSKDIDWFCADGRKRDDT